MLQEQAVSQKREGLRKKRLPWAYQKGQKLSQERLTWWQKASWRGNTQSRMQSFCIMRTLECGFLRLVIGLYSFLSLIICCGTTALKHSAFALSTCLILDSMYAKIFSARLQTLSGTGGRWTSCYRRLSCWISLLQSEATQRSKEMDLIYQPGLLFCNQQIILEAYIVETNPVMRFQHIFWLLPRIEAAIQLSSLKLWRMCRNLGHELQVLCHTKFWSLVQCRSSQCLAIAQDLHLSSSWWVH